MRAIALALGLSLLPLAAAAGPSPQFQNQIRLGLLEYNVRTDVSKLTTAQAGALHFLLTSNDDKRIGSYARTRNRILNILRKGENF